MPTATVKARNGAKKPAPDATVVQEFGEVRDLPIGLEEDDRKKSCEQLNGVLANSIYLAALYKKCHWLMRGITFYQLHLLLDKHADEQYDIVDELAERVQKLGGVSVGDPRHAAELTDLPRPPDGAENVPAMLHRLLDAHELTLERIRKAIEETDENDDEGSNDLLVSTVLRTNETQVWYIAEHLDHTPVLDDDQN